MSGVEYRFELVNMSPSGDDWQLQIRRRADGEVAYVAPLTFQAVTAFDTSAQPPSALIDFSITGSDTEAFMQGALDSAWAMGMRPTVASKSDVIKYEVATEILTSESASPTSEEMAAVRAHLEDMRQVAIRLLDAGVRPQAMEFAE